MHGRRILQILGDTEADAAHAAALDLHGDLAGHGVEVRTLALAPGRRGGLESTVPVIAPSRHGFAPRSAMATEARWADLVLLNGVRSLVAATMPGRKGPPLLVHLDELPAPAPLSARRSAARVARRARLVLVHPAVDVEALVSRWELERQRVRTVDGAAQWLEALSSCSS